MCKIAVFSSGTQSFVGIKSVIDPSGYFERRGNDGFF